MQVADGVLHTRDLHHGLLVAGELESFIAGFVLPLLAGGRGRVGRPPRLKDRDQWTSQLHLAVTPELAHARLRRAQLVVASPTLPEPDEHELSLWIGLHNLLVFEHPDRARVWTRATTWRS